MGGLEALPQALRLLPIQPHQLSSPRPPRRLIGLKVALRVEVAAGRYGGALRLHQRGREAVAPPAAAAHTPLAPRRQIRFQVKVFGGDEGKALALAAHDQGKPHALHAACRQARRDFAPEQGRHRVAGEAVQNAARLLRVDQVVVDIARRLEGTQDGLTRDLVEDGALDVHLGRRLQQLQQVPADGLAFPVLVRC